MKQELAKALMDLMRDTEYKDITIAMICDSIPISRNSFYYHFENKQALLVWACTMNYQKYCLPYHFLSEESTTLFRYIYRLRDFYTKIDRIDEGKTLFYCLKEAHKSGTDEKHVKEYTTLQEGNWRKINKNVYTEYATSGIAAVLTYWIESGYEAPIEEISQDLTVILNEPLPLIRDRYVY